MEDSAGHNYLSESEKTYRSVGASKVVQLLKFLKSRKPLVKRFWWVGLIILLLFVVIATAISSDIHTKQLEKEKLTEKNKKIYDQSALNENFPVCPKNLSGLFTVFPIEISKVDYIIPLGMMNSSSHTIPTDHMYINHAVPETRIPIYAPSDLTLIAIEDKVVYDSATGNFKRADYQLEMVPCRGLDLELIHFSELVPAVQLAYDQSERACETNGKYHFGNDMTEYYQPCSGHMNLKLKAGDLLGYIGGLPTQRGIDIGLYNYNTPPLNFVMPSRYSGYNLHAMCPLDPFTPELKAQYLKKVGEWDDVAKSFIPRTIEPICGAIMYDKPGTLEGNWFAGESASGSITQTTYMIGLAPFNDDPSQYKVSIKGPESLGSFVDFTFTPLHIGKINRDFSEVTADGSVYCYQQKSESFGGVDKNGKPFADKIYPKYLLELVDNTHLKIEQQVGICSSSESFKNAFTYER